MASWAIKFAMRSAHKEQKAWANCRLIALGLFLAVLFLPLHAHGLAERAQMSNECSCIHGTRTEAALIPAPTQWLPLPEFILQQIFDPQFDSQIVSGFKPIRAPPSL
jgi:hypothetical protein